MSYAVLETPIGELTLVGDGRALTGSYFGLQQHLPDPGSFGDRNDSLYPEAREQLGEYFAGQRTEFAMPLAPVGTDFQKRVWQQLRQIPFGETRSYGEIAEALGGPTLTRAVGAANGRNPLGVIVPCHRVIGADGSLTGYAGGLDRKRFLLELEGVLAPQQDSLF